VSDGTILQLYENVEKLAGKKPGELAAEAMIVIFNVNLDEAKKKHPEDAVLRSIPKASGEVRLGDLLVRVGQMKAVVANQPVVFTVGGVDLDAV